MIVKTVSSPPTRLALASWRRRCLADAPRSRKDGGLGSVETDHPGAHRQGRQMGQNRRRARHDRRTRVAELLAKPLSADDAVQVAMLNNRACRRGSPNWASPKPIWCRPGGCRIRISRCFAHTAATTTRSSRR